MEWGLLWSWVTSGRQRARVASFPLWRQLFALLCGRTWSQKQCFLPVSDGRVCWAQEVVSVAVGGRCLQGAGVLGPGHRRQWDSASRVLWPGCTSSSSRPFWKEEPGGLQASPSPGRQRFPESGASPSSGGSVSWWPQAGGLCTSPRLLDREACALPRLRF